MSRLGGVIPSVTLEVASILVAIGIISIFLLRLIGPSGEIYAVIKADLNAEQSAASIVALSTVEEGIVEKTFNTDWDILVYKKSGIICKLPFADECGYYIKFSHGETEGEARIIGDLPVKETSLTGRSSLTIKKEGEEITLI